ncbi:MAG: MBL fold metallo-hydrolase [Gemmatimonadetes bacterium]|nr:MBL fold metallo-hydrolase [Gemmatimonadota bacterium]NNK62758.1 MBL fold metallo-hydrolase [Gemmatimonadota bacterium]
MRPAHHRPDGGFRTPWLDAADGQRGFGDLMKWQWDRLLTSLPPDPHPESIPTGVPEVAPAGLAKGEVAATWLGHATLLIQTQDVTVLTDPIFSERASPFSFAGPARYLPAPLSIDELPRVDAVLLSHDHYDHLDEPSVKALNDRFGETLRWVTPLGYRDWFGQRGIRRVVELDWWDGITLETETGSEFRVTAAPAQHWTRRGLAVNQRLWASYGLSAGGAAVYFGGDSGYFDGYREIGARLGPFDLTIMPIGAYEPRWFMRPSHMNPEEAVHAYRELGGRGGFVGVHWGTFRLTDEDPLEPPRRARAAWEVAGLAVADLHEPGIGGTIRRSAGPARTR